MVSMMPVLQQSLILKATGTSSSVDGTGDDVGSVVVSRATEMDNQALVVHLLECLFMIPINSTTQLLRGTLP